MPSKSPVRPGKVASIKVNITGIHLKDHLLCRIRRCRVHLHLNEHRDAHNQGPYTHRDNGEEGW